MMKAVTHFGLSISLRTASSQQLRRDFSTIPFRSILLLQKWNKTIKLLGENMDGKRLGISFGNDILDLTPKVFFRGLLRCHLLTKLQWPS